MEEFCNYLLDLGYAGGTVAQNMKLIPEFKEWLARKSKKPQSCKYQEMLSFIEYMMDKWEELPDVKRRINRLMMAVTNYYDFLALCKPDLVNPARDIRVKQGRHTLPQNIIDYEEILSIYKSFDPVTSRDLRNVVMLGFMVFQALNSGELRNIKIKHIKFRAGKIFIPGRESRPFSRGSCPRELPLDASQLMDLLEYVNKVRPAILHREFYSLPGRKPDKENRMVKTDQVGWKGTIDISSTESGDIVREFTQNADDIKLGEYMRNATDGKDFDYKRDGDPDNDDREFHHRGSLFSTKEDGTNVYASARDAGNYCAGYIAGNKELFWTPTRKVFDAFEIAKSAAKGKIVSGEGRQSQLAQFLGWIKRYSKKKRQK